jgi:hypothetical protein
VSSQNKTFTYVAAAGIILTAIVVGAILYYSYKINATGRIKAIGIKVYADLDCTKEVSSVYWGEVPSGGYAETTVYIKNTGNAPVNLSLTTENWQPSTASQYLTLVWDYAGTPLTANEVRRVKLTLKVSATVTGITDFSFDIIITASG